MKLKNNYSPCKIIPGGKFTDSRGTIFHNNNFDLKPIRRSYLIENINESFLRGWKGHLVENRWFLCTKGSLLIYVTCIENLNEKINLHTVYKLNNSEMNILHVPPGHATLIKQITSNSTVMAFSDWRIGESNDEDLRWPSNIFKL